MFRELEVWEDVSQAQVMVSMPIHTIQHMGENLGVWNSLWRRSTRQQGTSPLLGRLDKVVLGQSTRADLKMEPLLLSNALRRFWWVLFPAVYFLALLQSSEIEINQMRINHDFYFSLQSLYDKHLGVEFQSEIQTLAQVEHLNLVRFYGYLEHGDERIVVVEYVPNGTLREHLDCEFSVPYSWSYCLDKACELQ